MQCQLLFRPKEFDKEPANLCYLLDMLSLQVVPYFPGLSSLCSWYQFLSAKGEISRKHACEGRTVRTCYTGHGLSCSKQGDMVHASLWHRWGYVLGQVQLNSHVQLALIVGLLLHVIKEDMSCHGNQT